MQEEHRLEGGSVRTRRNSCELDSPTEPISRSRRRLGLVLIAVAGCAAVLAVGSTSDNRYLGVRGFEFDDLLAVSPGHGLSSQASTTSVLETTGAKSLMQELLAVVEGRRGVEEESPTLNEGVKPVVLEEKAPAAPATSCDASCKQRKEMIASKMKALRDQINRDFSSMIDFGHKAGYLPPPQSIRQQVMDGTLLGGNSKTGANAVPPPPFKEKVSPDLLKATALKAKSVPAPTDILSKAPTVHTAPSPATSSPAAPAAARAASPTASAAAPARNAAPVAAAPPPSISPSLDASSDSDDATPSAAGGKKTSAAWAKAFSFIKHTNNPVDGNSRSHADVSEHSSASKKGDPLKSAEKDKFLKDFEDPSSKKKGHSHGHSDQSLEDSSSTSDSKADDPDSFLKKGSDPLKSAEDDKFLKGFLG